MQDTALGLPHKSQTIMEQTSSALPVRQLVGRSDYCDCVCVYVCMRVYVCLRFYLPTHPSILYGEGQIYVYTCLPNDPPLHYHTLPGYNNIHELCITHRRTANHNYNIITVHSILNVHGIVAHGVSRLAFSQAKMWLDYNMSCALGHFHIVSTSQENQRHRIV